MRRMRHRDTARFHLEDVARQHAWIDDFRTLSGERCDHGPIEVLDGEIVPWGSLDETSPPRGTGLRSDGQRRRLARTPVSQRGAGVLET